MVAAPEPLPPRYPDNIALRQRGLIGDGGSGGATSMSVQLNADSQAAETKPTSPEEWGKQLFTKHGCVNCHSNKQVAPQLAGLYGQSAHALANSTIVKADEAYIRESIVDPTAKVAKGYPPIMPSFKHLPKEEIDALIAYIKTL